MASEHVDTSSTRTLDRQDLEPADGGPDWLPFEEFPFASRYVEIDEHRLHFIDEGDGPPLLFAYDGMESFLWRDVIVRLREVFRCVAVDLPGTGLSTVADGHRPDLEEASQVVESFVRQLDLRDLTLVVHDVGGPVALGTAARMPERIRAIVVTESFGWPLSDEEPEAALMFGDAARAGDYLRGVDLGLRTVLRCRPVLLVFGGESPAVEERFPERWRERFPDAQLLLVEGGHHFPMANDPDLVARALTGWWREEVAAA